MSNKPSDPVYLNRMHQSIGIMNRGYAIRRGAKGRKMERENEYSPNEMHTV